MTARFNKAQRSVTLVWDGVIGAEIYPVFCERTPIGTGPYTAIAKPSTTQVDLTEKEMPVGVEMECWVRAALADGSRESSDSNHITHTNQ